MQAATDGKLNHNSDTGQASGLGPGSARSVQSQGTSANPAHVQTVPEWTRDLEYVFQTRTRAERERLQARALRMRKLADAALAMPRRGETRRSCAWPQQAESFELRVALAKSADWAEYRARAIAMPRADIVATCRKRWRTVACGCGWRELPVGCDATSLCAWCRKKHWRRWRHRITRSMDTHLTAARASWGVHRRGMRPGVYLVTFTGPHSGDIARDRERLGKAWRKLTKIASAEKWWSAYALTWEVAMSKKGDGLGHVHAHVACVSSWIPFDELLEAWRSVMPGARVLDVQAPNRKRNEAGCAASYLAKYVTKGVDPAEMTGQKAGELLVAFRGRRKVTTSAKFWTRATERACKKCKCTHRSVEAPCSLQDLSPGAVLRSMVQRRRWLGIQEAFPPWVMRDVRDPDTPSRPVSVH